MKENRPFIQINAVESAPITAFSLILKKLLCMFPNLDWEIPHPEKLELVVRLFPKTAEFFKVYRMCVGFNNLFGGYYKFSLNNLTYEM